MKTHQSWGMYPEHLPEEIIFLKWISNLPDFNKFSNYILPFGLGKSYGDSCQNSAGTILDTHLLSHFINFNKEESLLTCECGTTLASILDFIIPYGYFLPSTPGTKHITVGGAIANDVHGKNHHIGGTFGCNVKQFELVRSNGERMICSKNENSNMFAATIGGLGLTGLITWAEFNVKKCSSPFIAMESIKFDSLEEFFEINKDSEKNFDYTVAWVDCTATDGRLGRGLFNRGNHADPSIHSIPKEKQINSIPYPLNINFINQCSVNAFNMLYFNKQLNPIEKHIVDYNAFFYPLDAILNWNKMYGKNGFVQYQFVIPFKNGVDNLKRIMKYIAKSGISSFLTVLKTFGEVKSPGMLSFPRPGITLAIDFPMGNNKTLSLCNELDELVKAAGGVLYPAKDARMNGKDFRQFYPNWKEFSEYIDPKFSSSFWRRVMK